MAVRTEGELITHLNGIFSALTAEELSIIASPRFKRMNLTKLKAEITAGNMGKIMKKIEPSKYEKARILYCVEFP